jgi:hypothetical protein
VNSKKFIYRIFLSTNPERDCVLASDFEEAIEEAHKNFPDSKILNIQLIPDEKEETVSPK